MRRDTVRFRAVLSSWLLALLCCLAVGGCHMAEDFSHHKTLETLRKRGATRAEVVRELGPDYKFFERNSAELGRIAAFLRE
jgi:hypothetical protein